MATRTYVEVSNIKDRPTATSVRALWDRLFALEARLAEVEASDGGTGDTTTIVNEVTQIINSSGGGSSSGYSPGGTDVALADGGTGTTLADPGADRIMFWDDSGGKVEWLTAGTGLSIAGTTISTSGTATDPRLIVRIKAADETINNSDVLQDDDDLTFAVEANKVYLVNLYLIMNGGITADYKFDWSLPTGATYYWAPIAEGGGGGLSVYWSPKTVGSGSQQALTSVAWSVNGSATPPQGNHFVAVLVIGGTAGDATLQWAQNTATVADTKLLTGSTLIAITD